MFSHKVESEKSQLEIVYDVQWKTPGNDDDKAKIIGIVDTPDTYLDWNTFKSYLIQNSGNMRFTTDDIRISYLDSDDDLIPVDNASEFRECLKFSRTRARRGQKIMMKVSLVSNGGAKPKSYSKYPGEPSKNPKLFCLKKKDIAPNIKKTSFSFEKNDKTPKIDIDKNDVPNWFEAYMTKFKADLVEEITAAVVSNVQSTCAQSNSNAGSSFNQKSRNSETQKEHHQYYPLQHIIEKRKKKKKMPEEDSSDCTDGLQLQWEERLELLRHMQKINKREKKFEKKLDAKLEKLESKTKKIMEKKHNLWGSKKSTGIPLPGHAINSQSAEPTAPPAVITGTGTSASTNCDNFVANQCMDAVPVDEYNFVPHVLRGEMVHQVWKVINSGQKQWTDETELRFAWGSKSLVPLTTVVKCPQLKPGETGIVKVTLQAPLFPGHFESYWHFHHQGRRFGHWLGCAVIVDADPRPTSPLANNKTETDVVTLPVDLTMKSYSDDMKIYNNIEIKPDVVKNESSETLTVDGVEESKTVEPQMADKLETAGLHLQAFLTGQNNLTQPAPAEKTETEPETEMKEFPRFETYTSLASNCTEQDILTYIYDTCEFSCLIPVSENLKKDNAASDKRDSLERNLDTDKYEKMLTGVENMTIKDNDENEKKSSENVEDREHDPEYNSGSDSDNISIISGTISVDTDDSEPSDEFVVVTMPTCVNCEQEQVDVTTPQDVPESDNNNNMEDLKPFPQMPELSLPEIPELCPDVQQTQTEQDCDPNTVFIRDETGTAIPVAKVVQKKDENETFNPLIKIGVLRHSTFGDPNFGQGPNGPRFPFTEVLHSPPVSHNPVGPCHFRPQHDSPVNTQQHFGFNPAPPQPQQPQQQQQQQQSQKAVPIYSTHQPQEPMFYSFDEMYQAQEMAGAAAGMRGNAGPAAWTNAYHNIHTEQPKACKFTYAYTNTSKENLSNSSGSISGTRSTSGSRRTSSDTRETSPIATAVQILPETLVTGAVNVASSAINTARSVIDMLRPRHDEPLVAQWDPLNPATESALRQLTEMGFSNRELNITLLKKYKNDLARVISELVQ